MLPQIADFGAEVDALYRLLVTLREQDWQRATLFKQWTVNDIVLHLHDGDLTAAASAAGPERFSVVKAERQALLETGLTRAQAARSLLGDLSGDRLLERWHTQAAALCETLGGLPVDTRLSWFGPDMGLRMFATARQMETWAHGQAIYDLLGETREATDQLRNIAEIGVRTYGWTFANRGLPVPGPAPYVRLTAPSGSIWEWNEPAADNAIEGDALPFCQVVTQTRNIADTDLRVTGEPARIWMNLAQCFAGRPEDPPAPGTRRVIGNLHQH